MLEPVPEATQDEKLRVGLCADCRHMRPIRSDKGSIFFLCGRAATEPEFPKYPRLPVLRCAGYEKRTEVPANRDL
jgi:hypothetical protein